jgi:hypothetical protein
VVNGILIYARYAARSRKARRQKHTSKNANVVFTGCFP